MRADNDWYPVALSRDIETGQAAGTKLFDQELCLWRDSNGLAHIWEDRCPHRGMRLSFGFVRGDRIACLYHGWQYDSGGKCRLIPAHPDLEIPSTICVSGYSCVERLGMVWAYPKLGDPKFDSLPIRIGDVVPVRSLYIDCTPDVVLRHFAAAENARPPVDNLIAIDLEGEQLFAGVQPFGKSQTALHIVMDVFAGTVHAGVQRQAALWAADLRRRLEERIVSQIAETRELPS